MCSLEVGEGYTFNITVCNLAGCVSTTKEHDTANWNCGPEDHFKVKGFFLPWFYMILKIFRKSIQMRFVTTLLTVPMESGMSRRLYVREAHLLETSAQPSFSTWLQFFFFLLLWKRGVSLNVTNTSMTNRILQHIPPNCHI